MATSHETIHNVIRSRFKALVEDVETLATQYDNEGEDHPEDALWCRFTIRTGESDRADLGVTPPRDRTVGVAIAQLFDPLEKGDKTILAMADKIKTAFKAVTDTGVTFRVPSITIVGRDGKWWQVNVTCPFYADVVV